MRKSLCFLCFICLFPSLLFAQNKPVNKDEVKVFVDCNAWCDMDYTKTEINYIDFVPDRFSANVYVLVTQQSTGSGGLEMRLTFSGQENFKGMQDTLKFYRTSVETDAEYRENLVRYLKIGLTRYIAQTSLAAKLNISATVQKNDAAVNSTTNKKDKWHSWVYNIGVSGNMNSDDVSKSTNISGNISANRTTERSKMIFKVNISKTFRSIEYNGDISRFNSNNAGFNSTIVKSITPHWSLGGFGSIIHSTYSNYDAQFMLHPAVEYSFFPYKEAVKRSITLFYRVGPSLNNYIDSGYYDKPAHLLFQQSLSLNVGYVQKWGNVYLNASWDNFLNKFTLDSATIKGHNINTLSVGGNIDIRIVKGLSIYVSSYANFTKGIYPNIPRMSFSRDELLTNTRQYPTQKYLYIYFGINYRFGSIYNNVVNPRFNGSL